MKRKIKVVDKVSDKIVEHEFEVRNLDHFSVQLKEKTHVFVPKKGKGSFKRHQKHKNKN